MTTLLALNIWDYGIYVIIAGIATFVALLLLVMSLFSLGGDDFDLGGGDGGAASGIFSVHSIVGFFMGFGWGGVFAEGMEWNATACVAFAFFIGLLMVVAVAAMMKAIYSLKSDGTLRYETLVGMTANVYVTIPPAGETGGQVMVSHPSQLLYLKAVQKGDAPLPVGTPVKITEVNAGILTVEKSF